MMITTDETSTAHLSPLIKTRSNAEDILSFLWDVSDFFEGADLGFESFLS